MREFVSLPPARHWLREWRKLALIFLGICLIYGFCIPAYRGENSDGYAYLLHAQKDSFFEFTYTRHLLYHKLINLIHAAKVTLGIGIPDFVVLTWVSVAAASASVLVLVHMLMVRFRLPVGAAWAGGAFFALSYGVWRYAVALEVYALALLAVIVTLSLVLRAYESRETKDIIWAALAGAGACLIYLVNGIFVFVAFPIIFLTPETWRHGLAYGLVGGGVTLGGYEIAYILAYGDVSSVSELISFIAGPPDHDNGFSMLTGESIAKASLTLGHMVFSTNWLFAFEDLKAIIDAKTARFTDGIAFAVDRFVPFVYPAAPALGLLSLICLRMIVKTIPHWGKAARDWRIVTLAAGVILYGGALALYSPANQELWVMLVPLIAVALSIFVFAPLVRSGRNGWIAAFLAVMLAYNFFGGIAPLLSPAGDYYALRSTAVGQVARAGDVVLINHAAFDRNFIAHRLLHFGADVLVTSPERSLFYGQDGRRIEGDLQFIENTAKLSTRSYLVFGDFFEPSQRLKRIGAGGSFEYATVLAKAFWPGARLVADGKFGQIYRIDYSPALGKELLSSAKRHEQKRRGQ